jgi:large subunit ribosomal protein L15
MQLHNLSSTTKRASRKRVGRGGKRGTTSGHGTKGQKSRAGAGVEPGFRGGDNRLWQLFPKQRGASHKLKSKRPHRKHRFFKVHNEKPFALNVDGLNVLNNGATVTSEMLVEQGILEAGMKVKILGAGTLEKKLTLKGIPCSASAKAKIEKAGGSVEE